MSRRRLDPAAQRRGQVLASRLTQARHASGRSAEAVARSAGISVETVRSIERGRTSTPEFFTVAALAPSWGCHSTSYMSSFTDPPGVIRKHPTTLVRQSELMF
ncbi:helix-turn-helix domain-containing protein [Actinomadura monticuli]|uniref:Helix-turn-helix transcriptional regulator n=1 Tax=Actinomadura monticuli TaxID=3097367 RepID=A0ABV4QG45_9ACTN